MANHLSPGLTLCTTLIALVVLLAGCTEPEPSGRSLPTLGDGYPAWHSERLPVLMASARKLVDSTHNFTHNPGAETRITLQEDWIDAHDLYLQATLVNEPSNHWQIDPWPIEPGFLDSLPDYPMSGIVNDTTLTISPGVLRDQHFVTDHSEVVFGFHVLEYYAFERPLEDFSEPAPRWNERLRLVNLVMDQLSDDITQYVEGSDVNDEASNPVSYHELLKKVHQRCKSLVSELNQQSHGRYSARQTGAVEARLIALKELLADPTRLNHFLIELNPDKAREFNQTLDEALSLLSAEDELTEASASHLILLLSAIPQQLEEFARSLPGEREI